jgi:hypothetical protein
VQPSGSEARNLAGTFSDGVSTQDVGDAAEMEAEFAAVFKEAREDRAGFVSRLAEMLAEQNYSLADKLAGTFASGIATVLVPALSSLPGPAAPLTAPTPHAPAHVP